MQLSVKKLYLGGVKEPVTEDDLKEYFGKYGSVAEAIVMKDREGQYRGSVNFFLACLSMIEERFLFFRFGFVEFDE